MSSNLSQVCGLAAGLWVLILATNVPAGQDSLASAPTNAANATPQKLAPLPLPPAKPPIDFFRELLSLTPEQRDKVLSSRPLESRKIILAKIQEYEALSLEQRELRLRVTELRYYLLPLMSVAEAGRAPLLERVPAELRSMIEQRLRSWDELPSEKQKELLENETWLRHMAEASAGNPAEGPHTLANMPPAQRQALENAVRKWQKVSEDRRKEITQRFEEYFGLRPQERARTLRTFTELERHQMERTLQSFSNLSPEKRARCVHALDKLASMTPAEREEFLKHAERWQTLSPQERKAWRDLVFSLSLPPAPRVPFPPTPKTPQAMRPGSSVATNQ